MYAAERQQLLVERLVRDGRLAVIELAQELDVSSETIRRDLAALERDGLAQRVHGGAVAARGRSMCSRTTSRRSEPAAPSWKDGARPRQSPASKDAS